jgi:hypothetical protein
MSKIAQRRETRRRKRGTLDYKSRQKLGVSEEFLDRENFAYRWVNDDGRRVQQMTQEDDWDIVEDPNVKEDADGIGKRVSKVVGKTESGQPLRAFLCRKPKEFHEEDQLEKRRRVEEIEAQLHRGQNAAAEPEAQAMRGHTYVPEGGISIVDGRRS